MRLSIIFLLLTVNLSNYDNSPKVSVEEYIENWKDTAVKQMKKHHIPASIILAQGILESGFGNSVLAQRANNHFGIKCHGWTGKTFIQDDDKKNECFRKYKNASDSFEDHSEFLTGRSRYASLFELEITDYKSWATGLKKAGYATNPLYDSKLIELIERYKLYRFDRIENKEDIPEIAEQEPVSLEEEKMNMLLNKINKKHTVLTNKNNTKYVIANSNDTFYLIAKEFNLNLRQLAKWNDFHPNKDVLSAGDKVYIMRKRNSLSSKETTITVENEKNLWEVSQEHGILLKTLIGKNNYDSPDVALSKGEVLKVK